MREDGGRDETLWEELHRLTEMAVVPQFSREFYGLIVAWATQASQPGPVDWALRLLEIEGRYYRQLDRLEEGQAVPASLLEKRQIALQVLLERVEAADLGSDRPGEVARRLIMAECSYFLERSAEVVAHLEQAVESGGTDPLLCFALGHARFLLALRSFVRLQVPGAELVVADQPAMQSLCLAAVNAFEGALTGGARDAEVRWWIGRVLLAAGFTDMAQEILAQVQGPDGYPEEPAPDSSWEQRGGAQGTAAPIDEVELARFIEGVRGSHPLSRLL
jgi:hypothetical protein